MSWWNGISDFWKGFIAGGITVPLCIVLIEIIVKLAMHGKLFGK